MILKNGWPMLLKYAEANAFNTSGAHNGRGFPHIGDLATHSTRFCVIQQMQNDTLHEPFKIWLDNNSDPCLSHVVGKYISGAVP